MWDYSVESTFNSGGQTTSVGTSGARLAAGLLLGHAEGITYRLGE